MCLTICGRCKKEVTQYGLPAFRLWDYVTNYVFSHRKAPTIEEAVLDGIDCPQALLNFLEAKGIIMTTENDKDSIAIMPQGLNILEDYGVLCRRNHI